jgi:Pyridoxamine 5'-phosphate oxidase
MSDGAPHSVPVWIDLVGDKLALLTGHGSRKACNLDGDPRVAISIIDIDLPYASVLIRWRLAERVEGD